jgi:hypothetical protein
MKRPAGSSKSPSLAFVVVLVLKLLWAAFVIATPLLGAWVASSLASYRGGPVALAAATGLLLFPLLPLAWEAWANRRRRLKGVTSPRVLTFWDRFILRTLAVNLLFLAALLGAQPETAFVALSTRGDWMLEGRSGPRVESARRLLFRAADRLEWLYLAVHQNPYEKMGDGGTTAATTSATGSSSPPPPTASAVPAPAPSVTQAPAPAEPPNPGAPADPKSRAWPFEPALHPAVAGMPADVERSIDAVARYLGDRESDPVRRLKAAHDYVADRVAYDVPALRADRFPPQDAETVFRTRKGVCAGYSRLLEVLGRAMGLDVTYVVGEARPKGARERGESHAWNLARIGGREYLLDATWDSGTVAGDTFEKRYRADYFLTPPEVFGLDHFPDDPRHQLLDRPLSRGEFMRQPAMSPRFYAEGRRLLAPDRSQVTVKGSLSIEIDNPGGLFTLADVVDPGRGLKDPCQIENGPRVRASCRFPRSGSYFVQLFSNKELYGNYHYIGQLEANND